MVCLKKLDASLDSLTENGQTIDFFFFERFFKQRATCATTTDRQCVQRLQWFSMSMDTNHEAWLCRITISILPSFQTENSTSTSETALSCIPGAHSDASLEVDLITPTSTSHTRKVSAQVKRRLLLKQRIASVVSKSTSRDIHVDNM